MRVGGYALLLGAMVAAAYGCGSAYGAGDAPLVVAPDDASAREGGPPTSAGDAAIADAGPPLPECPAQRTVHIVAGLGALAWFTLLWPVPSLITSPQASDAYDDPAKAASVVMSPNHPLFARKIGTTPLWSGIGFRPNPTVFVAGMNQTHAEVPETTKLSTGPEVIAAGAVAQKGLAPLVPVLGLGLGLGGSVLPYGTSSNAPPLASVTSLEEAVALVQKAGLDAAQASALLPSAAKLASWGIETKTPPGLVAVARMLAFTAGAFRLGIVGTVVMSGMHDDPHGAFTPPPSDPQSATYGADHLALVLQGFYADLASANEATCGHAGKPLSLADNVVMVVSGDTPKDSFQRTSWQDGTIGSANLLFVRANGWLEAGWFGQLAPGGRTNFDPTTGQLAIMATVASSTDAALGGILYAISRGNGPLVDAVTTQPYKGTIAATPP